MKSSIKKILSISMTHLMVFSSLGGLSTVKINAAPRAGTSKDKIVKESEIEFTFGDIIDFLNCSEKTKKDIPKLVDRIPNIFNLLKVDRDIQMWEETMYFLTNISSVIICGEQFHNNTLEDLKAFKDKYIPVGNTLNEIRKCFQSNPVSEKKCNEVVMEFMKNYLGMTDDEYTKKLFKKYRKVLEIREEIYSFVRQFNELETSTGIRNLIEKINNSEKIRSELQDPNIKEMVDITLKAIKAKENLVTRDPDMLPDTLKAKKEAFLNAANHFETVVKNMPRKILMENLRDFDEKKLETESKSLGEEINHFEDISKDEMFEKEQQIKIAEEIKAKLIKIINSSDPDNADELDKVIEEMNTKITDLELLDEINRVVNETLKEHEKLMLEELSASMSKVLDSLKNIEKTQVDKNKSEKSKEESESLQKDQKNVQEEKVFTFGDLNEWMQNEKSQEKFELKMMEVCDLIDSIGNRGIWYTCLDQFEKCFESLTEDFTEEEKTELSEKVIELPIAGIFSKLRQIILDRLPEEEYLKAVSEFLGVPMKIKTKEETKKETIQSQQPELEITAENAQKVKEELTEIKSEEPVKPQSSKPEAVDENFQEIKEKPEKPSKVKPKENAEQSKIVPKEKNVNNYTTTPAKVEKLETINKNQSSVDCKSKIPSTKQEKTEKKKSFWSFILDLLEKLPLIGKLVQFLRK